MIKLFDKEYDEKKIPKKIKLGCGCVYKKDSSKIGISFSDEFLCDKHKPQINTEEEKQKKIQELKANTSNEIYKVYPLWKQVNINSLLNATQQEKDDMHTFIEEKIQVCDDLESQIV